MLDYIPAEGENYNNEEEEDGFAEELTSEDDNDEKSGTAMIENAAYKYFSDLQEKSLGLWSCFTTITLCLANFSN